MVVLIAVQVKDYAKKLVTAMIWFTSRMKLDPKKERWDLSLVVKSFVLQKQCFSNLCSLYKTLSGFEHSVCQLPTFYILACVAGVFLVRILFLVRIYTAARGQKSKRRGEMARRRKRVFLTSLLASPPPPPAPFPIIFWFNLGSGFRTAVSLTLRTTKEEAPTPRNHQDSCWKGAAG